MKLTLIQVGKTTDPHLIALIEQYSNRIQHYTGFETITIPELRNTKALSPQQQKEQEGQLILRQLQPADHLVLLDERGREPRSQELAQWLSRKQNTLPRRLVFAIGGPYGFSPQVYQRADEELSLSRLTFSHQMVRLFFVEQLYRAHTILRGEPYHHE
jgi:23S rRNA (pseudouridine1915-N3)-methyltransferase